MAMPEATRADRTGGEIDWPPFLSRTEPHRRERTTKFKVGIGQALSEIETELVDRLGVDDWRVSTAAPHRRKDGLPYADARPDDPGAVVRWTKDTDQYAVAADEYTKLRDNVRAIGLYITEKRKMSNRPVKTGQDEFATAQLPSGEEDDAIVATAARAAHEVLGVAPDAEPAVVRGAYRELVKEAHGDVGGRDDLDVSEIKEAKEAMLDG